jgi:hypothetical protein
MFFPWAPPDQFVWHLAAGYGVMALVFLGLGRLNSGKVQDING